MPALGICSKGFVSTRQGSRPLKQLDTNTYCAIHGHGGQQQAGPRAGACSLKGALNVPHSFHPKFGNPNTEPQSPKTTQPDSGGLLHPTFGWQELSGLKCTVAPQWGKALRAP